ncbi:MAG: dGTP triphosphohydrolase [Steroidobacter sp.]
MAIMRWKKLLSPDRLGKGKSSQTDVRSNYQRDFDRIVFCSAFRRLQDKTQVFPLAESDYVRTRLTHSIEVASVGRSLGALIGKLVMSRETLDDVETSDFGSIVAAACLAHDIGNPPFGHSGEKAISEWFLVSGRSYLRGLTKQQRADLTKFEGNAQGFRIITRLQNSINKGGLQLTYATLGAFTKYPKASFVFGIDGKRKSRKISEKKFGFFSDDDASFSEVAKSLGLLQKKKGAWVRHPLAFLVEAADDICYRIVDFEDGYRLGRVTFEDAEKLLRKLALSDEGGMNSDIRIENKGQIELLRALAINNLIYQVKDVFEKNYEKILNGTFETDLISETESHQVLSEIAAASREKVYGTPSVLQIEAAGFGVLGGLLSLFAPVFVFPESRLMDW